MESEAQMIAVITYDKPHRKTQDLLLRLKLFGYTPDLIVLKWQDRPVFKPMFPHRPEPMDITIDQLRSRGFCDGLHFVTEKYLPIMVRNYSDVLIGGCGIIPMCKAINAHPGYLPNVRGLDALKWAILEGQPIGVTTHFIGEEADTGIMIDRRVVNITPQDGFNSIARRVYDLEIEMLVQAIGSTPTGPKLTTEYNLHSRMRPIDEYRMMRKLEQTISRL